MTWLNLTRPIVLVTLFMIFNALAAPEPFSVDTKEFVGHYYPAPDNAAKSVVMVLGGSEGGLPVRLAQAVAEQGYPTLALAYFKQAGLPEELEHIPLEYFTKAKSWLMDKHKAHAEQIMLVGWSRALS